MAAGTEVEIISDHVNVMIIKDANNQRTHVMATHLSDTPLNVEDIPPETVTAKTTVKRKAKSSTQVQQSIQNPLF